MAWPGSTFLKVSSKAGTYGTQMLEIVRFSSDGYNRDPETSDILLGGKILVIGDQYLKSGCFSQTQ